MPPGLESPASAGRQAARPSNPPSSTVRVTDAALRAAKPRDKAYRIAAGGGLYLEVTPTGSKLWRWKYRLAGRENRLAIGEYPAILLTEARTKRDDARKLVEAGIHPSHKKRLDRMEQINEHAQSFETVAREWLAQNAAHWTLRTRVQREKALEANVFPIIGKLPVRQVTPAHVLAIIQGVQKRAPAMAVLLNQSIGAICRLAVRTLRAETDPTGPVKGAIRTPRTKHHRPLTSAELPRFLQALEDSTALFTNQIALKLLTLTLARSMEVVQARWEEFDLDAALWVIPSARMKMKEDHAIPLPAQAVALLRRLQVVTGHREFLFPNRAKPLLPASQGMLWKMVNAMGFKDFSPHGIRATGSTTLNEMGFATDVIEKQLAHEERNASRAAYNRAGYLEQRRAMMQQWADYLDQVAAGTATRVVPMKRAAG